MWREISIFGVFAPGLLLLFFFSLALWWLADMALAALGVYRFVWHPPLFRLSAFVCLFGLLGLLYYS